MSHPSRGLEEDIHPVLSTISAWSIARRSETRCRFTRTSAALYRDCFRSARSHSGTSGEAVVQPAPQVETVEVSDFEPRVPLRKPEANGRRNPKNRGRYSPESRKVGDAGEQLVMRYEQERLRKLGRHDFDDRVRWHTREQEFPGWDITSFDDDGKEFFIEVKSSRQ